MSNHIGHNILTKYSNNFLNCEIKWDILIIYPVILSFELQGCW